MTTHPAASTTSRSPLLGLPCQRSEGGRDGDGLRTAKTVAGLTTAFTWDPSAGVPLVVDDATNSYIYGPDGLPLEHIDRANTVTWYHHDQLGSTRALTSGTGATVAIQIGSWRAAVKGSDSSWHPAAGGTANDRPDDGTHERSR